MHWPEDRIARLTELWDRGWSASKIADEMGIGRGAVLSKARRLNLAARPHIDAEQRMVRVRDIMTDADLNHPIPLREAARMAGLAYAVAVTRWRAICHSKGETGERGDELVRPV